MNSIYNRKIKILGKLTKIFSANIDKKTIYMSNRSYFIMIKLKNKNNILIILFSYISEIKL
jgi:hypothetical protein